MCLALVLGVSVRFVNISQVAAEVDWGGGARLGHKHAQMCQRVCQRVKEMSAFSASRE